ncbi:Response regulator receiver domain-containing protein [Daejeonella rubra]|uniref:Response regulator receiver domain-containing protein n=1 Tax=Daejeonella rubra TaxID=990371 RepID=A0A1G9RJ93_9SPHI|nr:response regulator [Daejeonella rubra]SDM22505.1 Response regulator receiver domain-containing protein [Daejeonella rubra]
MSAPFPHFIIVDDSQLDCFIAEKIIQNAGSYSSVKSYMEATEAYEAIKKSVPGPADAMTIIVLDIQMPVMNGFQFVDAFEQLPADIRSNYAIFLFSSSINENDKNRLGNYPSIRRFYGKPISKDTVAQMIETL